MIAYELRAWPGGAQALATRYRVDLLELLAHARNCLDDHTAGHAETLEATARVLHEKGLTVVQQSVSDPAAVRVGTLMLRTAADMRSEAIAARGITVGEVNVVKSPQWRALTRRVSEVLSAPRFAPGFEALEALRDLFAEIEGDSNGDAEG